jgi:hypothetical protein
MWIGWMKFRYCLVPVIDISMSPADTIRSGCATWWSGGSDFEWLELGVEDMVMPVCSNDLRFSMSQDDKSMYIWRDLCKPEKANKSLRSWALNLLKVGYPEGLCIAMATNALLYESKLAGWQYVLIHVSLSRLQEQRWDYSNTPEYNIWQVRNAKKVPDKNSPIPV